MNNVYLIYGTDYGLIKREVDKIINNSLDVVKYDLLETKIDELLDDASCISLFGDKKVLIGENANFLTSDTVKIEHNIEYLSNYVSDNNHDNIIILTVLAEKLDERKKIVKLIKSNSNVIFKNTIDEKNLSGFVIVEFKNNKFKIDSKTANYFVNYVGKNVDILISEIEKMIIYKDTNNIVTIDDINDISCRGFKDNIFDLTDGIMKKDHKKIFETYNDLIKIGEDPIKIIALLGSQFTLIYQSKLLSNQGKISKDIAAMLDVHPYRVKLALETDFLIYELEELLTKLHELDFDIKSGKQDKNIGLENFLLYL